MRMRLICGFVTLTVLVTAAVAAGIPMKGRGVGAITAAVPGPTGVQITATGSGEGTHLGKFTRAESILLDPSTGTFTGSIVFTAADGSQLNCGLSGAFTGANTAVGTYTFTGGTGRFDNAFGSAAFAIEQSDQLNFSFEFAGTLD